jgi:hypothetical protein
MTYRKRAKCSFGFALADMNAHLTQSMRDHWLMRDRWWASDARRIGAVAHSASEVMARWATAPIGSARWATAPTEIWRRGPQRQSAEGLAGPGHRRLREAW